MTRAGSLRRRLTLAFALVAAALVAATGTGALLLADRFAWAPMDDIMLEEAETLAALRAVTPPDQLVQLVAQLAGEPDLGPDKFIRVRAPDGRTVTSAGFIPPPLNDGRSATNSTAAHTVQHGEHAYRVLRHPATDGYWTEIGARGDGPVARIARARLLIAVAGLGLLTILTSAAWAITTRATAELDRLADALKTIEAGSLDRRLAPTTTAEVERLRQVLNRLLERLEAAVAQLRRFTADAAHELRTPVAALRTNLEVALRRPPDPRGDRDTLVDALEQTERLGRLAEDLLQLSALESAASLPAPRPVALDALAAEVIDFMDPVAQEQHRPFTYRGTPDLLVRGSPDLLKRLVINLVDNAFRHTPEGTPVELQLARDGNTAVLAVHDEGPGIPADELPRIFDRFYRGRRSRGGTGLGMALAREIAAHHDGAIQVESPPQGGTTVSVRLPLSSAA